MKKIITLTLTFFLASIENLYAQSFQDYYDVEYKNNSDAKPYKKVKIINDNSIIKSQKTSKKTILPEGNKGIFIKNSPQTTSPLLVYRGIKNNFYVSNYIKTPDKIVNNNALLYGFVSCSLDLQTTTNFMDFENKYSNLNEKCCLKLIKIPIPSLEKQKEVVEKLELLPI